MAQLPILAGLAFLAFIAMVLAVPIGLFLLIAYRGRQRSAPLRRQAEALGGDFAAGRVHVVPREILASRLFEGSLDPKAYDLASGELGGVSYLLFDHASLRSSAGSIESGRRTAFVRRVVAALRLPSHIRPVPSETFVVEGEWLLASRFAEGTPSDRLAALRAALEALAAAAPEHGALALRALEGRKLP